jgi:hypothetical protein
MDDPLRQLRHDARGALHSIKLCVAALKMQCTPEEEMAFIDDVIDCSDKLAEIMVKLDAIQDPPSKNPAE